MWPDRIIATLSADPTTSFSVTWRTDESVGVGIAQIAPATADARFDILAETVRGRTERLELERLEDPRRTFEVIQNQGLAPVHHHSVTFSGLEANTLYAYRVRGAPGAWSPWRQLRTAPQAGPLQFVFFGDAQSGVRSHVTRVFDTAAKVAPNARFAIHGGDLVNTAMYDKEWAEWFGALGRTAVTLPSLPVTGNHDYVNLSPPDAEDTKLFQAPKRVSAHWRPQFTLPVVDTLPEDLAETVYDVRYSRDVHVFVLDSSGVAWDAQMAWLDAGLAATDATWTIVTMHHPLFSFVGGREHPSARERRDALARVLERRTPDVVLTGHRHTYQRGDFGEDAALSAVGDARGVDTVFVVTASTAKRGSTEDKLDGWERFSRDEGGDVALRRWADNTPLFAVFDVSAEAGRETLSYTAYDAVGHAYDTFVVTKDERGRKVLTDGPEALGETRGYANTGPYKNWDDLR